MSNLDLITYFLTIVAIALAPGPVVLMLIVRAAGNDIKGATGFGLGYALGGVAIITAVCFGLATWLTAVPDLFVYSKYALIAYLAWTAWGMWTGGVDLSDEQTAPRRSFGAAIGAGAATCLISPYMMILFPLVLPEMMNISDIRMPDYLIVSATTFLAFVLCSAVVIGFAAQLRRLAKSPRACGVLNRTLAIILVGLGSGMVLT